MADDNLDLPVGMFRAGETFEKTLVQMGRTRIPSVAIERYFSEIDGLAVFEGDIILSTAEEARSVLTGVEPVTKGVGITGEGYRWPDGRVPYTVDAALKETVDQAIAHWQKYTPIRLTPRTEADGDYVSFVPGNGCSSRVGRQGGQQPINLGPQCSVGSCIHEIGHTIGLWHEQSRKDRDKFIEIVKENIIPGRERQFDKHVQDGTDLGNYDFGSIMHYPATAFGIDGKVTIRVKGGASIGQRNGLSAGDVEAVRLIYPNLDWSNVAAPGAP